MYAIQFMDTSVGNIGYLPSYFILEPRFKVTSVSVGKKVELYVFYLILNDI